MTKFICIIFNKNIFSSSLVHELISIFIIALFVINCSDTSEPKLNPPQKVQLVPRSSDLSAIERGIDAVPEVDAIQIQWYKLNDSNLRYYKVYRRGGSINYFKEIKTIELEKVYSPYDTTYLDNINPVINEDPIFDIEYEYFVTAINSDNMEGANSDTAKYLLLWKPTLTLPGDGLSVKDSLVLSWQFSSEGAVPHSYILRIEGDEPYLFFARELQPYPYGVSVQTLNVMRLPNPPIFSTGGYYRWRIDVVGSESSASGSESLWRSFYWN